MSVGLLDVNMLIALAWPSHVHHLQAHAWFTENAAAGWATCPITQSGFVRISTNPGLVSAAVTPREAFALLEMIIKQKNHIFWPDDILITDAQVPSSLITGHRQITDAYLLGLAIRHGGRLVTLDGGISALLPANSPHRSALCAIKL